jgi:hypothetical protein
MLMQDVRGEQLLARLDPAVRDQMTPEVEAAVRQAAGTGAWDRHPIDLRVSLPWVGGRVFLALVGGPERRSAARRAVERQRQPVLSLGNVALFAAVGVGAILAFLAAFALAVGVLG